MNLNSERRKQLNINYYVCECTAGKVQAVLVAVYMVDLSSGVWEK